MLSLPATLRIFLAVEPADMRKGFDGLSQLVHDRIAQDPLSGHLYVFRNRRRDRVKILYWDPKSLIGEAIGYALNHWSALIRPLEAGFLEIDNGASERALKPVAPGRKNWLFAGSDDRGKTAATLMSLCTTCKDLGVDPFAYLRDVLERVSTHPNSRIEELLPDRWKPAEVPDPPGRKG